MRTRSPAASKSALFTWARVSTSAPGQSGRVRLPGLEAGKHYRLRVREELGAAGRHQGEDPEWVVSAQQKEGVVVPGSILTTVGLPLPTLNPQQAMLLDVTRIA